MNQLWNNYMHSMEQNQATTQATAKGINQWNKIIAGDASDLTEEERENLHMALDIMSTLPGGGVYDWLNAELDTATDFSDYYKDGFSVDIKNYNVESASGRRNLARNIEKQYYQRIENLPDGAKQFVMIDIRG